MPQERGAGESISRGKKSRVFHDLAAGKRERTRSSHNEANENPLPCGFFDQRGDRQLNCIRFSQIVATQKMAITRGRGERMR
jgi:hypothetical protein